MQNIFNRQKSVGNKVGLKRKEKAFYELFKTW